jgi:hypothetical protein
MVSVVCNNKFFFAGGVTGQYTINDVIDIFDPQTNSSSISRLSIARSGLSACATNDQAFSFGNTNFSFQQKRSSSGHNTLTSYAWTKIYGPSFNIAKANAAQTQVNNKYYSRFRLPKF